ncbi:hypothetical protein PV08_04094 [Exophiala spinifera]|uniref:AB hydrolase-1 domain-containing protein n=1 Tax=Exophiala spinifera TaxID=91928 RepID=A0A0D2BZX6_9EURO|nr:uncharacterized protein PV08_04094 [Exophiala spinifera]KIW16904.1 hypothetical protein PV08_04094 [Exophiala spinifera]
MVSSGDEDQAIGLICKNCFHQSLWLPQTAEHPRLRVTYSTTTNFDNVSLSLPVILFIGPMFGSRWDALHFNKLANDSGVRAIFVDRPGFGGSTPVQLDVRVAIWLETVPVLLHRLGVEHVSLVTHSAGTIYTLNTLLRYRSILDPKAPYVAFLAPFVPKTHSGAAVPTLAAKLPVTALDSWAGLVKFVNSKILPGVAASGGLISPLSTMFSSPSPAGTDLPGGEAPNNSTSLVEQYGFDDATAKLVHKLATKWQFAESNQGGNEEAKLCLEKSDGTASWGEAADYSGCARRIADNEAALSLNEGHAPPKLSVSAFFAGSDIMIAKRGQAFFEQCWQSDEVTGKVDFTTSTYPEANHDSLLVDLKKGALKAVFEKVAHLNK